MNHWTHEEIEAASFEIWNGRRADKVVEILNRFMSGELTRDQMGFCIELQYDHALSERESALSAKDSHADDERKKVGGAA